MLPTFNLYLSILSDELMPWLKENNDNKKFEVFIRKMGKELKGKPYEFFCQTSIVFGQMRLNASNKLLKEFKLLAGAAETSEGMEFLEIFAKLPVQSNKQTFYNIFIGQCLGAYYSLINKTLKSITGLEIREYNIAKLLLNMREIIKLPIPDIQSKSPEDIEICRKVQMAVAVLFINIKKQYYNNSDIELTLFDAGSFFESLKKDLLSLFDRLKGNNDIGKHSEINKKRISLSNEKFTKNIDNKNPLSSLLETNKDDLETEKAFEICKNNLNKTHNTGNQVSDQYIGSKEVCGLLNISKSTLYRFRKKGKIKFVKIGSRYRYSEKTVRFMIYDL